MSGDDQTMGSDTDRCTGNEGDAARSGITLFFCPDIGREGRGFDRIDRIHGVHEYLPGPLDDNEIASPDLAQTGEDRSIPPHPVPEDH